MIARGISLSAGVSAHRMWSNKAEKKGKRGAADASIEAYLELADKVAAVNAATEDAFPYGADVRVLDPAAGKGAEAAQQEATEAAQVICSVDHIPHVPIHKTPKCTAMSSAYRNAQPLITGAAAARPEAAAAAQVPLNTADCFVYPLP